MKYLGESFDIHTSSRELVFPHHENEMAIAGAVTGKSLAKYWLHCDRVLVDGKKIDENQAGCTLADLNGLGYSGRVIRYWLIASHYRKPVTFSIARLDSAKHSLKRLDSCIHSLLNITEGAPYPELDQILYDIKHGFTSAMDDDLNISAALASIFKIVKQINILILKKMIDPIGASSVVDAFRNIDSALKIFDFGAELSDSEIQSLIKQRDKARMEKNWGLADRIRNQLIERGITIKDGRAT
jgi:cysteinyl-tRNA synthetase